MNWSNTPRTSSPSSFTSKPRGSSAARAAVNRASSSGGTWGEGSAVAEVVRRVHASVCVQVSLEKGGGVHQA